MQENLVAILRMYSTTPCMLSLFRLQLFEEQFATLLSTSNTVFIDMVTYIRNYVIISL